jgi:uncharacterized membrane-anchored protein YitT (DUF2179 family)
LNLPLPSSQPQANRIGNSIEKLRRGVTIYQGKSGYGNNGIENEARDIITTVATRLEIPTLKRGILDIDPAAFIVQQSVDDTTGGLLKRKGLH